MKGGTKRAIRRSLDAEGMGGLLDDYEIEAIITEARAAGHFIPRRESPVLPRLTGIVAVIMGTGSILFASGRYGLLAIVLGLLLIFKPGWAKDDI